MIITQFFMTLSFIAIFVSLVLVLLYFLCGGPDQKYFLLMIRVRNDQKRLGKFKWRGCFSDNCLHFACCWDFSGTWRHCLRGFWQSGKMDAGSRQQLVRLVLCSWLHWRRCFFSLFHTLLHRASCTRTPSTTIQGISASIWTRAWNEDIIFSVAWHRRWRVSALQEKSFE